MVTVVKEVWHAELSLEPCAQGSTAVCAVSSGEGGMACRTVTRAMIPKICSGVCSEPGVAAHKVYSATDSTFCLLKV